MPAAESQSLQAQASPFPFWTTGIQPSPFRWPNSSIAAQQRSDAAYAEGEVDLNTLLMTQRQRIAVERSLVQQDYRIMQAMCELRRAVGGSFDPKIDAVPDIDIEARSPGTNLEGSS